MRFRLGLLVGAGLGLWVGTRVGQRHRSVVRKVRVMVRRTRVAPLPEPASPAAPAAGTSERARAVIDLGVVRARQLVDEYGTKGRDLAEAVGVGQSASR